MAKYNKLKEQKEKVKTTRIFKQLNLALLLSFSAIFIFSDGVIAQTQSSQTFSTAGTFTNGFTVPAGVTSITVQAWGAGGGGGIDAANNNGGPGGGGGAYASSVITVVPGTPYTVVVGAGGSGGINGGAAATAGGPSGFGALVSALGGGFSTTSTGAQGGQSSGSAGDIKYSGSNGGNGSTATNGGGGGGGASGNSGNVIANGANGATAGTGGAGGNGPDGDGGNGGNSGNGGPSPQPGTVPGGGGGGRGDNDGNSAAGATGRVMITWTCPSATISYTSSSLCTSVTSAPVTIIGTTGGAFSTAPATGLSITGSGEINPSTSTQGNYTVHYQIAGSSGCPAVDATAAVAINPAPVSTVSGQTNITCYSAADGTITVTASGGTSPYTFSMNNGTFSAGTTANTNVFTGLSPNTSYQIKVQDANMCISK